jgi:putative chitinase
MKYFTIEELCRSNTANIKGIKNIPTEEHKNHLIELIENILDPLREAWGSPIHVNSGYRSPQLNKAVGGSSTSAHSLGYAADLSPVNGKMSDFKAFVKKWLRDRKFDQYINEFKGKSEWVHIGYKNSKGRQRGQYLLFKNGKYSYIS